MIAQEALGVQDDPKIVAEIVLKVDASKRGVVRLDDFRRLLEE